MKINSKKYREQGQVLIFAIVILIILLIASLFLFDIHSVIRAKMKLETAEQSAALAAANWQKRSLNLIGDINLIKAVNGLLDDYDIYDDTYGIETMGVEDKKFDSANKTLTEMQSRISFCGPLIAFGAAQQAAKNNGINIQSGSKTVYTDMYAYLEKLERASNHPRYAIEDPYYYKWRDPYINMLTSIKDQGLAVRPSGDFAGIEDVDPPWLYTPNDDSLYNAITYKMWCHYILRGIIKYPDSYWSGKWYDLDFRETSFSGESEIYALGIDFTYLNSENQSTVENCLNNILGEGEWTIRPQIEWCTYDNKWDPNSSNYSGPNTRNWRKGMRIRDNLKKSVLYGGAVAYAECYQHIKLLNRYKSKVKDPNKIQTAFELNDKDEVIVSVDVKNDVKVGNNYATDGKIGGSVAKPLGKLNENTPPTAAIIVLPVFTNVALIPSSMQIFHPFRVRFSNIEKFLIWLETIDDLHNPGEVPAGMQQYLSALQKLDDPTFRKSGWNNDYVRDDSDLSIYFNNDYKYDPVTNPAGAGWLQQIWLSTDASREDNMSTELEEVESEWSTRIYSGKKYILKNQNGTLLSNEKMICVSSPGGPGGSTNDGVPTT
jgi:putative Flp pilus-assembly TadE/G-like protein